MKKFIIALISLGFILTGCGKIESFIKPNTLSNDISEVELVEEEVIEEPTKEEEEPVDETEEEYNKIFPIDKVISYYTEKEISVAVPSYYAHSENACFRVDEEEENDLVIWITNSSEEEFIAYKNNLLECDWTELDEENKLRYYNTKAGVTISYLGDGNVGIAFYLTEIQGLRTPEEALDRLSVYYKLRSGFPEIQTTETYIYFESYSSPDEQYDEYTSLNKIKTFVIDIMAHNMVSFDLIKGWEAGIFAEGDRAGIPYERRTYKNGINTVIEIYVFVSENYYTRIHSYTLGE